MVPLEFTPRRNHLVRFSPRRVAHVFTDVLVIGGGIAGLRAVLSLEPGLSAVVVSKAVAAVEIAVADQAVKVAVIEESDLSVRLLNNLTIRQKISSLIHHIE